MTPFLNRFWSKVQINAEGECWPWTASLNGRGYGQIGQAGKIRSAHRVMWEVARGPIPKGLTVDHLCRNRRCVNPAHLELVTMRENLLRGEGACARHARQSFCKYGHPLVGGNLRPVKDGSRRCLECHRRENRDYWKRRKARESSQVPILPAFRP